MSGAFDVSSQSAESRGATWLTWEEYEAGVPCRGCGLPWKSGSGEPWEDKGTIYYSDEDWARYAAEKARFERAHPDCHPGYRSVEGSLTMHCNACCPPPPLSPSQIDRIAALLLTRPDSGARPDEPVDE